MKDSENVCWASEFLVAQNLLVCDSPPQTLKLRLALSKARDSYRKGYHEVSFPRVPGRYDGQLIELAEIIRGEIENPYPLEHELLVQKCLLEACGYATS